MSRVTEQSQELERLAAEAAEGSATALEALLAGVRDDVYGLAVRMLWCPEDAADATQDILLKVMIHLGSFRGASSVRTWVFSIAANHLRTVRQSKVERERLTFDRFGRQLSDGLSDALAPRRDEADQRMLEMEVKIGCTTAMLLCLDRDHRIAYILGDVFDLASGEAAVIVGISAAAFRKRLERARERVRAFMSDHCGLVNNEAACRCAKRVAPAIASGRVNPSRLLFVQDPASHSDTSGDNAAVMRGVGEMNELHHIAGIFKNHPRFRAPDSVTSMIGRLIATRTYIVM